MEDCFWETSINDGSVILNWFAVPNATSYELYLFDTEIFEYKLVTETTLTENIVLSTLKKQSEYTFKLRTIIKESSVVDSKAYTMKNDDYVSSLNTNTNSVIPLVSTTVPLVDSLEDANLRLSSLFLLLFLFSFVQRKRVSFLSEKGNYLNKSITNKEHRKVVA